MQALPAIEVFVHVAEIGSFRGAAARIGLSPSAVSRAVSRLEGELGVSLFVRTTRSVQLTREGRLFLDHARPALDQLHAGIDRVAQAREAPRGRVRISLPVILADRVVDSLPRLRSRYPELQLALSVTDRAVRLVEEGFDLVVRIGAPADSSLIGRRLRSSRWITAASPGYLAQRGTPGRPDHLADHACLRFARPGGGLTPWQFRVGDEVVRPPVPDTLRIDDGPLLVRAACQGLGLVQGFDFMVQAPLADGRLVEVLESYAAEAPPVYALATPGTHKTPRVQAILELLAEVLG